MCYNSRIDWKLKKNLLKNSVCTYLVYIKRGEKREKKQAVYLRDPPHVRCWISALNEFFKR